MQSTGANLLESLTGIHFWVIMNIEDSKFKHFLQHFAVVNETYHTS